MYCLNVSIYRFWYKLRLLFNYLWLETLYVTFRLKSLRLILCYLILDLLRHHLCSIIKFLLMFNRCIKRNRSLSISFSRSETG